MKLSDWYAVTRAPNPRAAIRALIRQGKDRKLAVGIARWVYKRLAEREATFKRLNT